LAAASAPTRALCFAHRDHFTLVPLLVAQNIGVGGLGVMPVMPVKAVLFYSLPERSFIKRFARH
jgi:hypothetical protein